MYMYSFDYLFKVLLIGDSNVGKSCLLHRLVDDTFVGSHISTIGVDFKIFSHIVNDKNVKLQIWDTAGQERFRTITSSYYRGASCILIVFDITNNESYNNVDYWLKEIYQYTSDDKPKKTYLIGTKVDLEDLRKISYNDAKQYAEENNMEYYEVSAKNPLIGTNMSAMFEDISSNLMNTPNKLATSPEQTIDFNDKDFSSGCCK
jgi:Ras-related protein Rab-1A